MEEITLNLIPTGVRPTCHVSQNDNERKIKINLVEGSLAYAIKSGDIIRLNIRKPNDVTISSRVTATAGNTYVIVDVRDDMCNANGTNLCELRITNLNSRISTSNFNMEVETAPTAGGGGGGGASNLADLEDVDIDSPTNGQVLKYNSTTEMWENGTGGGGGASAMSDLTDVDLTDLADGDSLVYDDDEDEWKPQAITKEVTQAEYDALVQAGTVDANTAYFIKDTNGDGSKFQPVIYSEEEREIGVWTDGKPLYEKTITPQTAVLIPQTTWTNFCTFSEDIQIKFGFAISSGEDAYADLLYSYDNGYIQLYSPRNFTISIKTITIRYTKTTDTAGSGTWTPQGVPSHHYSTSEQVVGTWIDGKTVYERIFVLDTPLTIHSGSWGTTSISNAGMDTVIDGTGITASGTNWAFLGFAVDTGNYVNVLNTRNGDITLKTILLRYTKTSS